MEIDGNSGQFLMNKRQKLNTSSAKAITQKQAGQTKPPNINVEFEDDYFQVSREEVCLRKRHPIGGVLGSLGVFFVVLIILLSQ